MKKLNTNLIFSFLFFCLFSIGNVNAQCTSWISPTTTTGWNDFDPAPCDDGSGCAVQEITAFEIFAAEAYRMEDIIAGGSYTFSACNGTGGTAWDIDFTIIAPSGTVDASGLDPGSICAITFTASESGTYLLVVNEVGQCGGGPNTATSNGFPAFTCNGVACPTNIDVSITDNGDMTATASASGGQEPYSYEWSNGDMTATASNLMDGETYTVTVTDANGLTATASITIGTGDACITWVNPSPTTAWNDFVTMFGDAPCDDGSGCAFNEITAFQVFASEAYMIPNFLLGGTYTFSMCNGPGGAGTGGQAWTAEFTIIGPSGNVVAFGPGDGDGCSFTWTVAEAGTHFIVINEAGQCGGGPNQSTDNGYPAITCVDAPCQFTAAIVDNNDGTATVQATAGTEPFTYMWSNGQTEQTATGLEDGETYSVTVTDANGASVVAEVTIVFCVASNMITTLPAIVCQGGTFTLQSDGMDQVPDLGGFAWSFDASLGGTGALPAGFIISNAADSVVWDADLNGILSGQNPPLNPLGGTWIIRNVVYNDANNPFGSQCSFSPDSIIVTFSDLEIDIIGDNGDGTATVIASSSNDPLSYLWDDPDMQTTQTATFTESGTYTVVIFDALGCSTSAQVDVIVSGIEDLPGLQKLEVLPNPTKGLFAIDLQLGSTEDVQIDLINMTGQTVRNIVAEQSRGELYQVDISELPAGVYLIRFHIGGEQYSERVLLTK